MGNQTKIKLLLKQSDAYRDNHLIGEEEACLQSVLSLDASNLDAALKLANLRFARGQMAQAVALYQYVAKRLSTQSKNWLECWAGWIRSTHHCGLTDQSQRLVNRLMDVVSDPSEIIGEYVGLTFSAEQYEQTLHYLHWLVKRRPQSAEVSMMMGKTLHCLRKLEEAEIWYKRALSLMEKNGEYKEGDSIYEQYRWEYAMQCLLTGQFEDGWLFYESRLKAMDSIGGGLHIFPFEHDLWRGQFLSGKTLLVHGEQGIGDEIMFMSFANTLIDQCKHLIIACTPSLTVLFQRAFPKASVISHDRSLQASLSWKAGENPQWLSNFPEIDYQCPMGSIPFGLRSFEKEFSPSFSSSFAPSLSAYLFHDEQKQIDYENRINQRASHGKKKVGLMWDANLKTGRMGKSKSIALENFSRLSDETIQFISLQNHEYGRDFASVEGLDVIDLSGTLTDFDQTAALVAACDLIITVDTSVAHLAAAMGKPTWILLKYTADWRYLFERDDCIWYSSVKLFRQTSEGDWESVMGSVAKEFVSWKEIVAGK